MPPEIIARFRCPTCGEQVSEDGVGLICARAHVWPWRDGGIDAVGDSTADAATRRTAEAFGYQWTTFDRIQPEDEQFWEVYFRDVPRDAYRDKVALDAGCGMGRYTYFTAAEARAIVGLDNSASVLAAARNLADHPNACVVRADLRTAPFAAGSFEFISCFGVLHHLPSPEDGFSHLVRLLAPGGTMLLYLYSRPENPGVRAAGLAMARGLRMVTRRLPAPVVRWVAAPIAVILHVFVVRPGLWGARHGWRHLSRLALQGYRRKPLRSLWLDTFDRLSAPIEHRYVWAEVEPWFQQAGLTVLTVREEAGLFVVARRPPSPTLSSKKDLESQ